jgi:hypothetical protein
MQKPGSAPGDCGLPDPAIDPQTIPTATKHATARHPELVAAIRSIALGKLDAFENESWRLAELVQSEILDVADTVDALHDADIANGLSETFGADLVQSIMADAFAAGVYGVEKDAAA